VSDLKVAEHLVKSSQQYSIVVRNLNKTDFTRSNKNLQTAENANKPLCEVSGLVAKFDSKLECGVGFY
jgi:hypothetical protein